MAEENDKPSAAAPKGKGGMLRWVFMAVFWLGSAGAGYAVPLVLLGAPDGPTEPPASADSTKHSEPHEPELAYVPFGEVIANLDDHRMSRYLRAKFSLAVAKSDAQAVQHVIEEHKTSLKNWLIGYFQNKQVDEVRGTEGFNCVRREIYEQFNQTLFPQADEKIKEILFEEFNVQ